MSERQAERRAAALVIGNELLSGKVAEANIPVLAKTLRNAGVLLDRVVMVRDEPDVIIEEVRALSRSRDVLFTSGGVGPTHDDVTVAAIAAAFGVDVVTSPAMEAILRRFYGERLREEHLLMGRIPDGARLVTTPSMPWPTVVMDNVWIMPGVPAIFKMKMPVVLSELGEGGAFVSTQLYTTLDEGVLKPYLDAVVEQFDAVEVGSYPKWRHPDYQTKVTFDGRDETQVEAARDAFATSLPQGSLVEVDESEEP